MAGLWSLLATVLDVFWAPGQAHRAPSRSSPQSGCPLGYYPCFMARRLCWAYPGPRSSPQITDQPRRKHRRARPNRAAKLFHEPMSWEEMIKHNEKREKEMRENGGERLGNRRKVNTDRVLGKGTAHSFTDMLTSSNTGNQD